jgi:dipeptidyl aminopeptidase/acylaminoacyl peptidase
LTGPLRQVAGSMPAVTAPARPRTRTGATAAALAPYHVNGIDARSDSASDEVENPGRQCKRRSVQIGGRRMRWATRPWLLILAAMVQQPSARAVPLEVYGRLPSLEHVAMSPDGSRLAFVRTEGNERIVVIYSLLTHDATQGLRIGDQKLRSVDWADNQHVLIVTSTSVAPWGVIGITPEWYLLQVYDVDSHKMSPIPDIAQIHTQQPLSNVIRGEPMVRQMQGHTVVFVRGYYASVGTLLPMLLAMDLATGSQRVVRLGSRQTRDWLVDGAGEVAAESDYRETEQRWAILIRRDGRLQEAASGHEAVDIPRVLGFGPVPDTLLVQLVENGDSVWRLMSLKDGSFGPPMAERQQLYSPIQDRDSYRMIGGVKIDDAVQYVFFFPDMQSRWDLVVRTFPGAIVRLESSNSQFSKLVVRVDGPSQGLSYRLIDLVAGKAADLGPVYAGLTAPLEVRALSYPAADGLAIRAYLTLPRDRPPARLPLIVLPHGGPALRDTADFGWWPQAMADQGYAVLQPNYRGSLIDWPFLAAGFGQWGRKMQTDLSDGVRYLVEQGIADPARVCIVGASYGGYAALAGATLDTGVYRCAVSVAGPADLKRQLTWIDNKHGGHASYEQRYWDRYMGVSGAADPSLDAISPIRHVDAVTIPILLIHGRDDTVVPYEQSQVMYDALKRARKDVQFVTLDHEDHWLSRSETRLQMLTAVVRFLNERNPADSPEPAGAPVRSDVVGAPR